MEKQLRWLYFWVPVVMGGLDLAACDTSLTSVTSRPFIKAVPPLGTTWANCIQDRLYQGKEIRSHTRVIIQGALSSRTTVDFRVL